MNKREKYVFHLLNTVILQVVAKEETVIVETKLPYLN
jgi:hypothetical protein